MKAIASIFEALSAAILLLIRSGLRLARSVTIITPADQSQQSTPIDFEVGFSRRANINNWEAKLDGQDIKSVFTVAGNRATASSASPGFPYLASGSAHTFLAVAPWPFVFNNSHQVSFNMVQLPLSFTPSTLSLDISSPVIVTLNIPNGAPPNFDVTIQSNSPNVTINNQQSVTISVPLNATSQTFTVQGTQAGTYMLTASFPGYQSAMMPVTVNPPAVTALSPTSGPVGMQVSVTGTGFAPSHSVSFAGSNVSTTFVSATEVQFKVPQHSVGAHPVTVAGGVGSQAFTLTAGALTVSPVPLDMLIGADIPLTVSLPLAAPPGDVDLIATATPTGVIQLAGQGQLSYSRGSFNDTVLITPQDIGSGTITVSGDGYTTASVPFTVSFGTPQCGVRARAQGGVEFVSPPGSNNVVGFLSAPNVPGRIETAPGGARAVVQYSNGIAFVDLVNCDSLGNFQSSTIPLNNFAFSADGRFFVADWFHASQNDGLVAYNLVDGSQLFNPLTTTSNSLNVLIAGDSMGTFAFWVTSTNTPQGAQPQLSIHALNGAPTSCFVGNVPSNNLTVSMSGGVATIQFLGISPPQTWRVQANNCSLLP